jgi:F-type H+-transporting ATPase subunit delta
MAETSTNHEAPDAGQQAIAAAYAKALLATTEKSGGTAVVLADFEALVRDVLAKQARFADALTSPRIAVEDKVRMIDNVFSGRVPKELLNFLKVVAKHERLDALKEISREYRDLYNEKYNRVRVVVTTAEPLTGELHTRVAEAMKAKLGRDIDLAAEVDPNVLGGMVVRVGDTVYDSSLRNRLDRQRQVTIKNSIARLQQSGA